MGDKTTGLGWWVMSGEQMMRALKRVEAGESPDEVYMELYVNSTEHGEGNRKWRHDIMDGIEPEPDNE